MAFNTFRGCALKEDDIQLWKDNESKEGKDRWGDPTMTTIAIRGQMSTSLEFEIALGFASSNKNKDTNPVMLITTIQNYAGGACSPQIFLLDNASYSAYSTECECLIRDGAKVWIMKVEKAYSKAKKKVFTIVHLYHDC